MKQNENIKIIKPTGPKPISKTRTEKNKDTYIIKPEIPEFKKSAWDILPDRYRNLKTGR